MGQQTGFYIGVVALMNITGAPVSPPMPAPTKLPALPEYLRDLVSGTATAAERGAGGGAASADAASAASGDDETAVAAYARWDIADVINNTAGNTDIPIYGVTGK